MQSSFQILTRITPFDISPASRLMTLALLIGLGWIAPIGAAPPDAGVVPETNAASAPTGRPARAGSRQERLSATIEFLASDALEGRGVGTSGIVKAADFLAERFAEDGLLVQTQSLSIVTGAELDGSNRLVLVGPADEQESATRLELELKRDFRPLAIGGSGKVEAACVFVGYGITSRRNDFDEYDGLDVEGKVVLMLRKEPQQDDENSVFAGKRASRSAFFSTKISNAYEHGAAAVILVNDHFGLQQAEETTRQQWATALDELVELRVKFREQDAPDHTLVNKHREEVARLAERLVALEKKMAGDFDEILPLEGAGYESSHRSLPVFFARRAVIDKMFQQVTGTSLEAVEREIDEDLKPQSRLLDGLRVTCEAQVVHHTAEVKNVIGILEGQGPLADETVIVGAHYDHLGRGGPGSLAPWTKEIHNGADDNASGTAALLEIAHRFAQQTVRPSRRLVFIAFAGEERGLLGSAHYVANPLFPLEKTIAMVNMDMVGRLNDNKLIVYGTGTASEFDDLIDGLNRVYEFDLNKEPGGFGPSDHSSFYAKEIPVFHFFTGTHRDYHRPSDDFDKINFAGIERISDMIYDVVQSLAETASRPQYQQTRRRMAANPGGGDRPYFGSIPDFGRQVEGYALMGVTKDSPAERAGIQEGDVIVRLGESRIGGLEDFDSALRKFSGGDEVKVVVSRDGEQLEVTVTLDPPR